VFRLLCRSNRGDRDAQQQGQKNSTCSCHEYLHAKSAIARGRYLDERQQRARPGGALLET